MNKKDDDLKFLPDEETIYACAFTYLISAERKKMYEMIDNALNKKEKKYVFTEKEFNDYLWQQSYVHKIIRTFDKVRQSFEEKDKTE